MNYEKLKLQECSNIIQNKNRGVLSLCGYSAPYQELVFYDTDCFCGCLNIYFKTCDCGTLMKYLKANNSASLLISRKCNNYIETVIIEGDLEVLDDEVDCCCKKKDECFKTVQLTINNICGKKYYMC